MLGALGRAEETSGRTSGRNHRMPACCQLTLRHVTYRKCREIVMNPQPSTTQDEPKTKAALHAPSGSDAETVPPAPGTLVRDTATNRIGRVMDGPWGTRVALRPEGGGTEWDAELDKLRPVSMSELLSARVAEANRRSRGAL